MSDEDEDVEVQPAHFLTGDDDPTIGGTSVLSSPAEWHALAVGAIAGTATVLTGRPEILGGLLAYIVGRGTGKRAKQAKSGHIRDAVREPVYTGAGAAVGALLAFLLTLVL